MAKTAPLGLRISPELKQATEEAAAAEKRSVASFVEIAIEEKLVGLGYWKKGSGKR